MQSALCGQEPYLNRAALWAGFVSRSYARTDSARASFKSECSKAPAKRSISPRGAPRRIAAARQSRVTIATPAIIASALACSSKNSSTTDRSRPTLERPPSESSHTSMSALICELTKTRQPSALRQLFQSDSLADLITAWVGQVLETIQKVERLEDSGEDSGANSSVPPLNAPDGHARGCGSLRDDFHRKSAPEPRGPNVRAELSDGAAGSWRRTVRSRHCDIIIYH